MNTKFSILASALASLLLMGCGPNLVREEGANENGANSYYSSYTGDGYSDGGFTCPNYANITPSDPRGFDGTPYTGCSNANSLSQMKIKGRSPDERNICVFPVRFLNETQFVYNLDQTSQPLYSCYDAWSNSAAVLDFPYAAFNGAVVVEYSKRAQMSTCLVAGQNCPDHSIGRIR